MEKNPLTNRIQFVCEIFICVVHRKRRQKSSIRFWDSLFNFSFFAVTFTCEPLYRKVEFKFVPNRRGGTSLIYNGFTYTVERKYKTTTNWVCNKNSNSLLRCPARCVTSEDTIKLSRREHNHSPSFQWNSQSGNSTNQNFLTFLAINPTVFLLKSKK